MQDDRANYGRPREPGDEPEAPVRGYEGRYRSYESPMRGATTDLSPSDERSWSALAHLSVLINLVTGFGGLVAAPVVWLVYRDRSPKVAFHALQSFWYQAAWAVALTVGWTITLMLMIVLVGFLLLPFMALASLVPFVHGSYAAYKVNQGVDYRYPFIANMLDGGEAER
jgi:uncharacterized protein